MMTDANRRRLQTVGLGTAAALLFAPVLSPGEPASPFLFLGAFAGRPRGGRADAWWLVVDGGGDAEGKRDRFGDAGRFYVVAFLLFWGTLATIGIDDVALGGRLAVLGVSFAGAYWLGYLGHYRTVLARLRDAWVKDLSEEERRELEAFRNDDDRDDQK
jgi:hypothetical protein